MATLTGTFEDWLKGQGYTIDPEGGAYSYLDAEGSNTSLTGENERLGNMQRAFENRDFWAGELSAVQSGNQLGEKKYMPKSANTPSYDQWLASGGQARGDNPPEYEYLSQFYNIPDYSAGNWMEQFASSLPLTMSGAILGLTAGPALLGEAGAAGAETGIIGGAMDTAGFVTPLAETFGTTAPLDLSGFSTAGTFTTPFADAAGLTTGTIGTSTSPLLNAWDLLSPNINPPAAPATPEPVVSEPGPTPVTPSMDNPGGLSGQMGDSVANYTAQMGDNNLLTVPVKEATSLSQYLIDWAKDNQMLASAGVNLAGGLIRGAMAPTPEEIADERIRIDEANRVATRIPSARWPRPTRRVLRTPGQLPPGLINRAMVPR